LATGRGPAWLRRCTGGAESTGSNPVVPTVHSGFSNTDLEFRYPALRCGHENIYSAKIGNPGPRYGACLGLGLDLTHLETVIADDPDPLKWHIDLMRLRDAGVSIAAAWFTVRGCTVSLPIEQATYDLLVHSAEGIRRVQVKTTTTKAREGGQVIVGRRPYSAGNLAPLMPYDPKVIDYFFIVDGDLYMYLIPSHVIAGRVGLGLRTYKRYIVGNASGLLGVAPGSRKETVKVAVRSSA
jgi:hypothetical protein